MSGEIDQIKDRLGVVEFIGEYLKLEKAGSNYKGLCPFHNEKTPSFMVNPDRNFWYCFGCQKGGDIFNFIQEIEGINFPEALQRLAEKTGVELQKFSSTFKRDRSEKQRLFEILKLATQFYQYQLKNSSSGVGILKYLHGRKISDEQIANFRIGFAPQGWENIHNFLLKKGYSSSEISKSGLLVQREEGTGRGQSGAYDRFRDRIVFPVIDVPGNVVGFSARVAPGGDETTAKYINSPETSVYDKSSVLYGLFQAKTEIRKKDFVVVAEGNVDVIASHCAGVGNIVAVSGTALTEKHLRLIKRYTQNVKLCFDMDGAGRNATQKSIRACLLDGLEVEIILLPKGFKDIGDLVQKEYGLWAEAVEKSSPVMEYFFSDIKARYDPDNVKDKKNIAKELLNIIKDIADPIEQSYWLKKLSSLIQVEEEVLTGILEKATVEKNTQRETTNDRNGILEKKSAKPRKLALEESVLGLFYLYKQELKNLAAELDQNLLSEDLLKIWRDMLSGKGSLNSEVLERYSLNVKYRKDDKEGFVENEVEPLKEWDTLLRELAKEAEKERRQKIMRDIRRAEQEGDDEAVDLLMREFNKTHNSEG